MQTVEPVRSEEEFVRRFKLAEYVVDHHPDDLEAHNELFELGKWEFRWRPHLLLLLYFNHFVLEGTKRFILWRERKWRRDLCRRDEE